MALQENCASVNYVCCVIYFAITFKQTFMKKLKLGFSSIKAEILNREQLKSILGGDGSGSGGEFPKCGTLSCAGTNLFIIL